MRIETGDRDENRGKNFQKLQRSDHTFQEIEVNDVGKVEVLGYAWSLSRSQLT